MSSLVIHETNSETFKQQANELLGERDATKLFAYIEAGKYPLAPNTASSFFQLYLNGSSCEEIAQLNKGFALESIHWAMIKFNWPIQRDTYLVDLQEQVRMKLIKTQMEATGLIADMITAANKKNSDKIKKYIQTGNDDELRGVMNIETLGGLLKAIEGLQKITGQDKTVKIKTENTENINVSLSAGGSNKTLNPESAAKILEIISEEKRKSHV